MHVLNHPGAWLRSVKLHGEGRLGADPLHARQQLERTLADVDWSPPSLPPQALLFVRKLVADGRRDVRPRSEGGSFGRVVSLALREQAESARRPWLHADAADAAAVCFADQAELIACLLRDSMQGCVPHRWWWRSVLGNMSATAWVRLRVLTRGELIAPALVQLAEGSLAAAWVARLTESDARLALHSVEQAYGVVPGGFDVKLPPGPSAVDGIGMNTPTPHTEQGAGPIDRAEIRRLLTVVPELGLTSLSATQARVLACALATARAPGWLRTASFGKSVSQWSSAVNERRQDHGAATISLPGAMPSSPQPASAAEATQRVHQTVAPDAADDQGADVAEQGLVELPRGAITAIPQELDERDGEHVAALPAESDAASLTAASLVPSEPSPIEEPAPRKASRAPAPASAQTLGAAIAAPIHTQFGGIFYLLNAALALDLYGDFTQPRAAKLALSPWDLLAWTGQAWFGNEFVRDPVWVLLAALSGRALDKAPGHDFAASTSWRPSAAWLTPWSDDAVLLVHATAHRLRAFHPQGFAVFDVARDPALRPLAQARALCPGHALRRWCGPIQQVPRNPTARWLHHWLAYLNARMRLALGEDSVVAPARLCRYAADIRVSNSSVDVHLALADLPLSVRFAGLDRDAGWIPAAGRSLMFRFT